jgi:hypothetical protein
MDGGREDVAEDKSRNNRHTGRVKGRAYKNHPQKKYRY